MSKKFIFQVGDVVYHPLAGKTIIRDIDDDPSTEFPYLLEESWAHENELSFTEWPKPYHERPLKDGLYKGQYGTPCPFEMLFVRHRGKWFVAAVEKNGFKGGAVRYPEDIHSFTFICEIKE